MKRKACWFLSVVLIICSCSAGRQISKNPEPLINGTVATGFETVKEEFVKNFKERDELGASFCVYYKGKKVVDLWGGYRDHRKKDIWEKDDLVMVFSTTKGLAAICLAIAHSNGWLNYDEKVTTYWPEFGENGKENITVRQLLGHEAGLILIDPPMKFKDLYNLDFTAQRIAAQKPVWEPGTKHGYHALTLGLYMNELFRRVEPKGRSIGIFFQEEIARPLDVEFYIGLPDSIPDERLVRIKPFNPFKKDNSKPENLESEMNFFKNKLLRKSMKSVKGAMRFKRETLKIENPSGNGVGQARAIAKIYGEIAAGGKTIDLGEQTISELSKASVCPMGDCKDTIIGFNSYFSLGFFKPGPMVFFGSSRASFGTPGAGGSFGFADPDKQIGYCYAMSKMALYPINDPREKALRQRVYKCIEKLEEN
jgi:CubicO group peptidase (beta-lactamase class C family)